MKSYEGNENYIFVSYAHKDAATVVPLLERLSADGFRVWYDAGIEAGTEWPEYIADHLMRSSVVLVFMSNASAASPNCRKEINFALELGKELLVVYLEDTQMSAGMRLQLNTHQAMFRKRHKDEGSFVTELERSKLLLRAKIGHIQKDDDKVTGVTAFVSQPSARTAGSAPYIISTVCSYASNNAKNPWQGGTHVREISVNRYSTVHFQCRLSSPFGQKGKATAQITVYNYADVPVFTATERVAMTPKSDHFAFSWVIRDKNGTFQAPGDYTAHIQFENSEVYEYTFTIQYFHAKTSAELREEAREEKRQRKQENRRRHHRGLFFAIPLNVAFNVLVAGGNLVAIGVTLIFFGLLFRFTKKYVTKSFLWALMLCTVFCPFYTFYMLIMLLKRIADR